MNALSSFIGQKKRAQVVWTPPHILDAVDRVFPDGWGDVFPSPGSPATTRATLGPPIADAYAEDWYDRNFANPEYATLAPALERAARQWREHYRQSVQLVPLRPRRDWFCEHVRGAAVAYLKPFAFYDAATGQPFVCVNKKTGKATVCQFPENLVAVYWGDRKATFEIAFRPHMRHFQPVF